MTTAASLALLIPVGYLLGSIPFGLVVGLAKGVDPRKSGSGNIGATNIGRILGLRYFWLVFALDLLKSLLPMLAAAWLVSRHGGSFAHPVAGTGIYLLWLAIGLAGILGHMFSFFLGFKGGKGVATSAGVLLGLFPYYTFPGLLSIGVFILVFFIWRYISLASVIGVACFPVIYLICGLIRHWPVFSQQLPLLVAAVLVAALIIVKHRPNLARLRAGTEHRLGNPA
ncbi:MAG: glycerol-3-phosphate 1-O-acyltransferase PlsY [Phycisphaerales bacterium]|nr:glycerol-3-phosphate 1-O-acyltransferase PlsY [Phycisphaerales bacterium]